MKFRKQVKKYGIAVAVAGTAMASVPAFAADDSVTTAINGAVTAGKSNVGLVVAGAIGIGALMFGLGSIMGVFRKA